MTDEIRGKLLALFVEMLPQDGGGIGNIKFMPELQKQARLRLEYDLDENIYLDLKAALLKDGSITKGRGRGGSIKRNVERKTGGDNKPVQKIKKRFIIKTGFGEENQEKFCYKIWDNQEEKYIGEYDSIKMARDELKVLEGKK
jgi:hypothetical protein